MKNILLLAFLTSCNLTIPQVERDAVTAAENLVEEEIQKDQQGQTGANVAR